MPKRSRNYDKIAVIDLFAGPGGLGEGFSSLEVNGRHPFEIVLSAEKEHWAQQTLELRSFVRLLDGRAEHRDYLRFLRGELMREELLAVHGREAAIARSHARQFELGGENRRELENRLNDLNLDRDRTIVIGGPPCQAYSVAGRSRNAGKPGWRLETDDRSELYKEYLHVLGHVQPAAFVMENVRGLLSARFNDSPLFETIVQDLRNPIQSQRGKKGGRRYRLIPLSGTGQRSQIGAEELLGIDPEGFLIRAEEYGVPQARHRVIIVGIAEDLFTEPMAPLRLKQRKSQSTVRSAIGALPRLRSAVSSGPDSHERWIKTLRRGLRRDLARGVAPDVRSQMWAAVEQAAAADPGREAEHVPAKNQAGRQGVVINHSARTHMESDIHRYLFAAAFASVQGHSPTLADFPEPLLPDHANVAGVGHKGAFNDRFRVQCWDGPSTTIVSHISKDGHYYIHPDPSQCRSLTVREAARLQTFPDDYLFCGPRTSQYQQVGNAVPVALARQIAEALVRAIA